METEHKNNEDVGLQGTYDPISRGALCTCSKWEINGKSVLASLRGRDREVPLLL